ncbi:MAG: hypothetical protein U0586_10510 [Candidatus Brocadiaceae bacterium]
MTLTMHFDGTQHVVIASICSGDFSRLGSLRAKQSFPHEQTPPPDKK